MGLVHITYNTYKVVSFWPKICYTIFKKCIEVNRQDFRNKVVKKKFVLFFHHEDESALPSFYFGKGYPSPMAMQTPNPSCGPSRNFGLSYHKTSKSRRLFILPISSGQFNHKLRVLLMEQTFISRMIISNYKIYIQNQKSENSILSVLEPLVTVLFLKQASLHRLV